MVDINRQSWPQLFELVIDKDMIPTIEDWGIPKAAMQMVMTHRGLGLSDAAQFFNRTVNRIKAGKMPLSHYNLPTRAISDFRSHKFDAPIPEARGSQIDEKAIRYVAEKMPGINNPEAYLKDPGRRQRVQEAVNKGTHEELCKKLKSLSDEFAGRASEFRKIYNQRLHYTMIEKLVGDDINARLMKLEDIMSSTAKMIEWYDKIMAEEEREAIHYRSLPPYLPGNSIEK
jgi:hypothetical protein